MTQNRLSIATIISLVFLLFFTGCGTLPKIADSSDVADLEFVVSIDGKNSNQIYDGVRLWIADNFRSAKQVIDFEDRANGVLIANGVLTGIMLDTGMMTMPQKAGFKMKVEVKDGKMRLTFSQFEIIGRTYAQLYKTETMQIRNRLGGFGDQIRTYLSSGQKTAF